MTAATINRVNDALKAADLPIYISKGDCYFWFGGDENAPSGIEEYIGSIYSNHIRDLTVEEYVAHVKQGVAEFDSAMTFTPI